MILVIDSSSSIAGVALLGESPQEYAVSARSHELVPLLRRLVGETTVTTVAVATGPGSFTGLRVGVSFGLGLAVGLKIPIVPLPSLALQAARSEQPVIAVVEAGRGRFYFEAPGSEASLGQPEEIPKEHPIVGRLSSSGRAVLEDAGHRMVPESELGTFAAAAAIVLEKANKVAYGSLEIEYMQSFRARG